MGRPRTQLCTPRLIASSRNITTPSGPLSVDARSARALKRRGGGGEALLWLAQRTAGGCRVYIIEVLCEVGGGSVRPWLLRNALDGDFLKRTAGAAVNFMRQ
jgi:hypothetical protein